jgi:hypothetical protein
MSSDPIEARFTLAKSKGTPFLEGNLLKKNKFFMKQERRFKLYPTGEIKYFKGQEEKGCLKLEPRSKARKISRTEVELFINKDTKVYVFLQIDVDKMPKRTEGFSCILDDWVEHINRLVQML